MPYACPHCSKDVTGRWPKATELAGGPSAGFFYFLLGPFFRTYRCEEHGQIPRAEFPTRVRRQMLVVGVGWVLFMLLLAVVIGWVLYRLLVGGF